MQSSLASDGGEAVTTAAPIPRLPIGPCKVATSHQFNTNFIAATTTILLPTTLEMSKPPLP